MTFQPGKIYLDSEKTMVSTLSNKPRDPAGQTLIELVMFLALFAIGFTVGHFVALKSGIVAGIVAGFLTCYGVAVAVSLVFKVGGKCLRRGEKAETGPDPGPHGRERPADHSP